MVKEGPHKDGHDDMMMCVSVLDLCLPEGLLGLLGLCSEDM